MIVQVVVEAEVGTASQHQDERIASVKLGGQLIRSISHIKAFAAVGQITYRHALATRLTETVGETSSTLVDIGMVTHTGHVSHTIGLRHLVGDHPGKKGAAITADLASGHLAAQHLAGLQLQDIPGRGGGSVRQRIVTQEVGREDGVDRGLGICQPKGERVMDLGDGGGYEGDHIHTGGICHGTDPRHDIVVIALIAQRPAGSQYETDGGRSRYRTLRLVIRARGKNRLGQEGHGQEDRNE